MSERVKLTDAQAKVLQVIGGWVELTAWEAGIRIRRTDSTARRHLSALLRMGLARETGKNAHGAAYYAITDAGRAYLAEGKA